MSLSCYLWLIFESNRRASVCVQVQVVPLPPPKIAAALEPPVVPLRVPKSVRERQEAAAAAAAQPEAADVSADVASDPSPKQAAVPGPEIRSVPSPERPPSSHIDVPAPKAALDGKTTHSEEQERLKETGLDNRKVSARGRSLSPSPARSLTRSPPRKVSLCPLTLDCLFSCCLQRFSLP